MYKVTYEIETSSLDYVNDIIEPQFFQSLSDARYYVRNVLEQTDYCKNIKIKKIGKK